MISVWESAFQTLEKNTTALTSRSYNILWYKRGKKFEIDISSVPTLNMRAATFVILCCALQYIAAQRDVYNDLVLNPKNMVDFTETDLSTTDEYEKDSNGTVFERVTTRKKFERDDFPAGSFGNIHSDEKVVRTFVIESDGFGHDVIYEEDVVIKKVPGTHSSSSSSSSSASSASGQGSNVVVNNIRPV
ncbi:hypothetical protein JYU34_018908, partial [Plutella xylostella]